MTIEVINIDGSRYLVRDGGCFVAKYTLERYTKASDVMDFCVLSKEDADLVYYILTNTDD